MQSGELEIERQDVGMCVVVRVRGSVHLGNSHELRRALQRVLKRKAPAVLVSLDAVDRVDTSGLATIVECAQAMQRYGGKLAVSGLSHGMTDKLSLAQVKGLFPAPETEAEALKQLGEQG